MENQRKNRLILYVRKQDDIIADWDAWPAWAKDIYVKNPKSRKERFQLFRFLAWQGVQPEKCAMMSTMVDYKGVPMLHNTQEIEKHRKELVKQAQVKPGTLKDTFWRAHNGVYSLHDKRVVRAFVEKSKDTYDYAPMYFDNMHDSSVAKTEPKVDESVLWEEVDRQEQLYKARKLDEHIGLRFISRHAILEKIAQKKPLSKTEIDFLNWRKANP